MGAGDNDFLIISVGELNDNKNHQVIVKAMKELPGNVKYLIAGRGEQRETLELLTRKLNIRSRVKFLGCRSDIKELLWASDRFAFLSKREGLGLAAIEVMSAGLSLIAGNVGGIKDYCINGVTGYQCDSQGTESFLESIKKLIDEKEHMPEKWNSYFIHNVKVARKFDLKRPRNII